MCVLCTRVEVREQFVFFLSVHHGVSGIERSCQARYLHPSHWLGLISEAINFRANCLSIPASVSPHLRNVVGSVWQCGSCVSRGWRDDSVLKI